jgi:hypothetical protein
VWLGSGRPTVGSAQQNCIGIEAHGIGKKELKAKRYLD